MPRPRPTYRVHRSGEWHTHRLVWDGVYYLRAKGAIDEEGASHFTVAATLYAFLALEGALNYVGALFRPDVWQREREFFAHEPFRGTLGKLDYLLQELGLTMPRGRRPYSTAKALQKWRHLLAHPRTQRIDDIVSTTNPATVKMPQPDYFALADERRLDRYIEDVETICDAVHAAAAAAGVDVPPKAFVPFIGHHGTHILSTPSS